MLSKDTLLPCVSVIIPTYRDLSRLELCLKALNQQSYPRNRFEIIVVNNDPEECITIDASDKNFTLIEEVKAGSYAARNAGIKAANGEILAFTDSDCIPDKKWLESGVKFLLLNPQITYSGGKINLYFKNSSLTLAEIYEKTFAFRQEKILCGRKYSVTANMMALKKVFTDIGCFDEQYLSTGDLEWGNRASECGHSIGFSEKSIVYHPARYSLRSIFSKSIRVAGGQFLFAKSIRKRALIIFVGFFPPIMALFDLLGRKDINFWEKIVSLNILYVTRIIRSIIFILIALGIMKGKRA